MKPCSPGRECPISDHLERVSEPQSHDAQTLIGTAVGDIITSVGNIDSDRYVGRDWQESYPQDLLHLGQHVVAPLFLQFSPVWRKGSPRSLPSDQVGGVLQVHHLRSHPRSIRAPQIAWVGNEPDIMTVGVDGQPLR